MVRVAMSLALGGAALLAMGSRAGAQTPSSEDRQLVARVAKEIFEEVDPPPGWAWPPLIYIVNYKDGSIDQDPADGEIDEDEINADATVRYVKPGKAPEYPSDTSMTLIPVPGFEPIAGEIDADGDVLQPVIRIYQGYLTIVVQGEDAMLAATFGHEMQHILLGHVSERETGTPVIESAIQRQQETDADIKGFALAVSAGYPYDALFASVTRERDILGRSTSFQAYRSTHPGYTDRVAIVAAHREEVWRALSAFENGVMFLTSERYDMAAESFREVVARQPECYEGWANLGYAELMQYYGSLDDETLRSYDIGQLALGGFYNMATSLGIRGADKQQWQRAFNALQQALILNPDLVVARANFAAAHLIHPLGKDVGTAAEEFAKVVAALESGKVEEDVDARMCAALFVNAGVTQMADGDPAAAEALFARARELYESDDAFAGAGQVASAVRYNRALLRSRSSEPAELRTAIDDYAAYLAANSASLAWWSLAFDAYEKLSRDAGVEPRPRAELAAAVTARRRLVTGVQLANGEKVMLDEPMTTVEASLGQGVRTNQVRDTNVHRRRYIPEGLDLWANNRVLMIRLVGKQAPPLVLETSGAGPGARDEVRVGMTFAEVQALVGEDAKLWEPRNGPSFTVEYQYFYRLGFGVRVSDSGRVTEILVAQLPPKSGGRNVGH